MNFNRNKLSAALLAGGGLIIASLSTFAGEPENSASSSQSFKPSDRYTQLAKINLNNADMMLKIAQHLQSATVSQDSHDRAIEFLQRAADLGSAEASFQLGLIYSDCSLMAEDEEAAEKLFKQAATRGHTEAKFVYAHLLDASFGVGC